MKFVAVGTHVTLTNSPHTMPLELHCILVDTKKSGRYPEMGCSFYHSDSIRVSLDSIDYVAKIVREMKGKPQLSIPGFRKNFMELVGKHGFGEPLVLAGKYMNKVTYPIMNMLIGDTLRLAQSHIDPCIALWDIENEVHPPTWTHVYKGESVRDEANFVLQTVLEWL